MLRVWNLTDHFFDLQIVGGQLGDHEVAVGRVLIVDRDDIGFAIGVLEGREVSVVVGAGTRASGQSLVAEVGEGARGCVADEIGDAPGNAGLSCNVRIIDRQDVFADHDILLGGRVVDDVEPVGDDELQVGLVAPVDVVLKFPRREILGRVAGDRVLPVVARVVAPAVEVERVAKLREVAALAHDLLPAVVLTDGVVLDFGALCGDRQCGE